MQYMLARVDWVGVEGWAGGQGWMALRISIVSFKKKGRGIRMLLVLGPLSDSVY